MIGEIDIVRHPVNACVPLRHKVVLSVWAKGRGKLHYQWFNYVLKDGKKEVCEVPGATQPNLTIRVTETQNYSCRVNDIYSNCRFTKWSHVLALDIDKSGLPPEWRGEPHIAVHPKPQTLRPGAKLTLRCTAFGVPQPKYQWYRNGTPLRQCTGEMLQVMQAGVQDAGTYLCAVTSVLGESWSDPADVDIQLTRPSIEVTPAAAFTATDKVALLIGNLNYAHHPGLTAPVMDVHELGLLLQQLGFKVLSLLDLTAEQMSAAVHNFTQLLDTGVYGLFYYAGHGFERAGRNYLVPVDAPQPYHTSTCVCVQRVMGKMQEKRTALSVILLDACRKWSKEGGTPSVIQPLRPTGNTVYGYATSEDAEAFEVQDLGKSTGIFTKYLNKHLLLPEKVTHVLERVSEDVDKDLLVKGKQAVEIRHSLKEARSLTDPVHSAGHTRELRLREVSWRHANELPQKKCLKYPCGAEVEVGFSALFSNVLVVFASIKRSQPHVVDCTVALSSAPAMEDIFSGHGRSEDFDSLLFGQFIEPGCTIWLCGLQTLEEPLFIRVDLHYSVHESESVRRCTQSQKLNVGKPLVASCGLRNKTVSPKHHNAQAYNANVSQERNQGPSTVQGFSRKAEGLPHVTVGRNTPEEHDEEDTLNFIHLK
ncbi:mucosa-associated lymphoid tissue lymphoma translocation protein 1 [Eucyclogobius newberryi]|uniref:mucosa-associated lymphoid tissue lymphoma translocation protein 1 n=1 Tax=Eucyclogobius newberryi TaxID=166745 RepID=UPI003B5B638C